MKRSSETKAIIFDLGRVVVDIDVSSLSSFFTDVSGEDADSKMQTIVSYGSMSKFLSGAITPEQFHKFLCDEYGLSVNFSDFRKLWCSIFRPMPDTEKLLWELNGKIPLGLLSDADILHWNYLIDEYPILKIFPKPTLSFETGVLKPSPEAYLTAAKNIDTDPRNCLFIDDLEQNTEGARAVGMDSIHFKGIEKLKAELTSRHLL